MKAVGNPIVFVLLYLLLMLPTYVLPWLGSNSAVVNTGAALTDQAINLPFWIHLGCLFALCFVAWSRGSVIDKQWLVIFPVFAGLFDLLPFLNWMPFWPTLLHVACIVLGVVLKAPQRTAVAGP